MSRGWWNSLLIVVVCWSLACSKPAETPSTSGSDGGGSGKGADSKNPVGLMPPSPDEDSGTARVSDKTKSGKARIGDGEDDPFKSSTAKESSPVDQSASRSTLDGRWILVLTRSSDQGGFFDFHTGILKISGTKTDAAKVVWESQTGVIAPATLKSSEVTGSQIQASLEVGGTLLDFRGKLKDGTVYGNAVFGNATIGNCLPARLMPTSETSLDGFNASPESPDLRALMQVMSMQDPKAAIKGFRKFITERPESPLSMQAWESLILVSAMTGGSTDDVEQLSSDYEAAMSAWGPRLKQAARGSVSMILAQSRFDSDFSLKYIAAADKAITDESLQELKEQLKTARDSVLTVQNLKYVESDDPDRAKKAFDFLSNLRKKNPFDPAVLYGMARYHENAKQIDQALVLFAAITTLPRLESFLTSDWAQRKDKGAEERESPSETLTRLWEAKKGSSEGLDEFKQSVYQKQLLSFADQASEEPGAGNRLVLCELFTGGSCPPCVGADVATAALEVSFPRNQVIVLRYHQHIPGPDPLTNADGEERFSYYRLQGTPAVQLNGEVVNNVGGYLPQSPQIYQGLKQLVTQRLKESSPLKVRVNARVEGDNLRIVSDVQGLDQLKDVTPEDLRLRIVIAEDEIHYLAKNGIRSHEMIVRRIVGGAEGIAPKDGQFKVSETIPLTDLKTSLAHYLKKYEDDEGIDFPAKPLDLKRLHIVAFLQNDDSHEVLQTNFKAVEAGSSAAASEITPATGTLPAKTSSKKTKSVD